VGYVRNLADGGVEVEAEGAAPDVDAFLSALKQGSPGSAVRDVTAHAQPTRLTEPSFEVRV